MNVDFLPDDTVVKSIDRRMVCTRCGVKGADVRPDWPSPY
jgi:nitrate reductase cytochrome c-type subunit